MMELYITSRSKIQNPYFEDKVEWETVRKGGPGKLKFKVLNNKDLAFWEGDEVIFKYNGNDIFFGYVFTKKRNKEQIIEVTCYDQLRYFKNKHTYLYENIKANQLLGKIIEDFELQAGEIEDTQYIIESRIQDNKTLFDIIYDALDLTLENKNKLYCLYDNFGRLNLRDVEKMKLDDLVLTVDEESSNIGDYEYKTDIDSDTYNRIFLYRDNEETGKREKWRVQDGNNINKWGVLQYYQKIDENTNAKAKIDALLKLKNRVKRELKIKDVKGDVRARAGTSPLIHIENIGDISIAQFMLIEKAKHTFTTDYHSMDLEVRGNI